LSTSPSTTFTTNIADSLIVWLVGIRSNITFSAFGTGQSNRGQISAGGQEKMAFVNTSEITTTAGSNNQSATASATGLWIALAIEIKKLLTGGEAFDRTATQTITISIVNPRVLVLGRTVAQSLTHSESIARAGSTFNRTIADTLIHSESIVRLVEFPRIIAQTLTHSESIVRIQAHIRTFAQNLIHSSAIVRLGEHFRTFAQALTHSESLVKLLTLNRTATTVLIHSESISRAGSTFNRTVVTITTADE